MSLQSYRKASYIVAWWRKKLARNIKHGSKMGAENRDLEKITVTEALIVEDSVKWNFSR